jgi:hypothetical protein
VAKSEFRKFIDQAQELPSDVVLGNIVWHRVNDGAYALEDIEKSFDALGLNPTFVPQPTTEFNAFEKACTNALRATKPYALQTVKGEVVQTGEIMAIREAHKDGEQVIRHVVREVRDRQRKRLRYETVAELILMRAQPDSGGKIRRGSHRLRATIHVDRLVRGEQGRVEAVVKTWEQEFDRLYNFIDGDKARAIVRDYLGFLNAVMMKQGVYFVHKNREEELFRLQTFVDTTLANGCGLELFPIPELKRLRESVIDAFQDEAVKELNEVVAAINKVRSTRATITGPALAKLTDQYQNVMRKANEYTRTLRCTQDRTAGAAEVALESLNALRSDMQKQMEEE